MTFHPTDPSGLREQAAPLQFSKRLKFLSQEWLKLFLPVLTALSFLSVVFSVFSPAPLLILYFLFGRKWAWLGAVISGSLVGWLGGSFSFLVFGSLILPISLVLAEFLFRKFSLEKAVAITLFSIFLIGAVVGVRYYQIHHLNPWVVLNQEFKEALEQVVHSLEDAGKQPWSEPGEAEVWKATILAEMPSAVAIFALILVWANLMFLLRLNPKQILEYLGLQEDFYRKWKAPEFLVWPTLAAGFFLLIEVNHVSLVALNLFKFLMAIYALQGLSVLSFYFEALKVRRFFRGAGLGMAAFFMRPLLLVLGFFDLWFDFRSKIRQS